MQRPFTGPLNFPVTWLKVTYEVILLVRSRNPSFVYWTVI
ncbi:rCG63043, isoform CRA_b [Rattus norvegicus]|uniref:RCG63043, isoform CRA_b n=1 Tax=Rattus norvegicus TaxID=10116 RepID=A6HWI4_RAT|nr:rCG63043, isoform CRA_b [Rattus norvegicus]EDL82470.1 rCG63043, isoform CRA_b [Rattus norvegicus]